MDERLDELLRLARRNPMIKAALLATKKEKDPMKAFCEKSTEFGFEITVGELFCMGLDFYDTMIRSVNGGGVNGPDNFDDMYEMFFAALKNNE